jgi:plastocyanin
MRSPLARKLGLLAAALTVCACGGGGSYDSSSPSAPSPTPGGGASSASTTVSILGDRGAQSFSPNPATAAQSQTIAWRNTDGVIHRIVANDGSFDTGDIAPGATSAPRTLTVDGANYHCSIHPGMVGAINSAAGQPPPCSGAYCDPDADY